MISLNKIKTNRKIYISYLFAFTIPLLIMGIICYCWMMENTGRQVETAYVKLLEQTKKDIEKKYQELEEFSDIISQANWLQKIAYINGKTIDYTRMDVVTLNNHLAELSSYKALNGFAEEIAIYIKNKDMVLYSNGIDSFKWFFSYTYNFDGMLPDEWEDKISRIDYHNIPVIEYYNNVDHYGRKEKLLTFVKILPFSESVMFILINEKSIKRYLEKLNIGRKTIICIYDKNNDFITGINYDTEKTKLLETKISYLESVHSYKIIKDINGNKYFMFHEKSDIEYLNWSYMVLLPYKDIMGEITFIRNVFLVLTIGLLLLGIIFSYGLTILQYKPVKKLLSLVFSQAYVNIGNDEYSLIGNEISKIRERERNIIEEVNKLKELELRDVIVRLINGTIKDINKARSILAKNGFKHAMFTIMVLINSELDENQKDYYGLNDWTIYLLKQKNKIVAFVNYEKEEMLEEIIKYIRRNVIISDMIIGVGNSYPQDKLWKSYNEAEMALNYEILKNENNIIYFNNIEYKDMEYYFPVSIDKAFMELLQTDDFVTKKTYLDTILKQYILHSQVPDSIRRYLFYKQTQKSLEEMDNIILNDITAALYDEYKVVKTLQDQQKYLEKYFKMICTVDLRKKEKYNMDITRDIIKYIENNYNNHNLCLKLMADEFHITSYHMCKLFKECLKENFIDYITKYRIKIAKELLKEKRLSIEEVGRQVGYENTLTFRRAFKRYEYQVPSEYRQSI